MPLNRAISMFFSGADFAGPVALALALSLDHAVPYRDQIVIATFAVVAVSIIVQGSTMPMLVHRLKIACEPERNSLEAITPDN